MSEESSERFYLDIATHAVFLYDTSAGEVFSFSGPDRLLAATAELNRLRDLEDSGRTHAVALPEPEITPAAYLAETLPAVARRQRLQGFLAEVQEIRRSLVAIVREDTANLNRAIELERRLMAELSEGVSPLGATETAQNGPGVGEDAIEDLIRQGALRAFEPIERDLFKPSPY